MWFTCDDFNYIVLFNLISYGKVWYRWKCIGLMILQHMGVSQGSCISDFSQRSNGLVCWWYIVDLSKRFRTPFIILSIFINCHHNVHDNAIIYNAGNKKRWLSWTRLWSIEKLAIHIITHCGIIRRFISVKENTLLLVSNEHPPDNMQLMEYW